MREILQAIVDAHAGREDLVMATIIDNVGSSPRSAGTKMLIKPDLSIIGTIGGGKLEANAILAAKEVFQSKKSNLFHFILNGEDAAKSDMICGGSGDVLLVFLPWDDPETTLVFEKALDAAVGNQEGWLITQFRENGGDTNKFCFVDKQGEKTGNLIINGEFLSDMRGTPDQIAIHSDLLLNSEILVEKIKERSKLYIFGGGHVAKETARLADEVSFETIVLDDRAEFANKERFPNSKIMVVPDYKSLPDLPIDHQSVVVILTRGHLGDYDVLKEMLKTDAFYIGMIGSIHKRNLIYERLLNEGVSQKEIDRVHSPIGLPINGETPTEIAISIIAELILERSKLK